MGYGEAVLHGPGVPPGVQVGDPVGVAEGGTVGVGLAQPPPATLTSTEVVVLTPV
jgi:ethanolamine utilization protein EutQ (cupin superfamily)